MKNTFGSYIKLRRKELGLPLKTVALHLNIDISTLGKIEKNERLINLEIIDNLSDILKSEKSELLNYYYTSKIVNEIKNGIPYLTPSLKIAIYPNIIIKILYRSLKIDV